MKVTTLSLFTVNVPKISQFSKTLFACSLLMVLIDVYIAMSIVSHHQTQPGMDYPYLTLFNSGKKGQWHLEKTPSLLACTLQPCKGWPLAWNMKSKSWPPTPLDVAHQVHFRSSESEMLVRWNISTSTFTL